MKRNCEQCQKPMSRQAMVCPHCGAPQSSVPDQEDGYTNIDRTLKENRQKPKAHRGTVEDAKAILATSGLETKVLTLGDVFRQQWRLRTPMPWRFVEGILTWVALPLLVAGVFSLWSFERTGIDRSMDGSLGKLLVTTAILCSAGTWIFFEEGHLQTLIIVMTAGWMVRGLLRLFAAPNVV